MTIHSMIPVQRCGCDDPLHLGKILTVDQAIAIARSLVTPILEAEKVPLGSACGRVAVHDVRAPRPMPFFDQSAMDGFAVRLADLEGQGPWCLSVTETIAAGDLVSHIRWQEHTARRIYTGAAIPTDADAVVMIEDCIDEGDSVIIQRRPRVGENTRLSGSDIGYGELLIASGTQIEPRHIGQLAANGICSLEVFRKPRVGVYSTGRELVSHAAPEEGRIFDANRPMLIALIQSTGAQVFDHFVIDDDLEATVGFFHRHANDYDVLISSGAVSCGGRDFIRPALELAGGAVRGWKVALKPGKPVLFGMLGRTAYFGLPGNPLAAYVCFEIFVREQLLRLGGVGVSAIGEMRAIAGYSVHRKAGRTEYVPARIASWSPEGLPVVEVLGNGSSGTLHALAQADGLVVIPPQQEKIELGDTIDFVSFRPQLSGNSNGDLR